jgi:hypothetical protein
LAAGFRVAFTVGFTAAFAEAAFFVRDIASARLRAAFAALTAARATFNSALIAFTRCFAAFTRLFASRKAAGWFACLAGLAATGDFFFMDLSLGSSHRSRVSQKCSVMIVTAGGQKKPRLSAGFSSSVVP